MMLDWFNTDTSQCGAEMIRSAVRTVFSDRQARTRDMGGKVSTTEMGSAILAALPDGEYAGNTP
jgi:isocitrate/isopropylmalate dehydrogenase